MSGIPFPPSLHCAIAAVEGLLDLPSPSPLALRVGREVASIVSPFHWIQHCGLPLQVGGWPSSSALQAAASIVFLGSSVSSGPASALVHVLFLHLGSSLPLPRMPVRWSRGTGWIWSRLEDDDGRLVLLLIDAAEHGGPGRSPFRPGVHSPHLAALTLDRVSDAFYGEFAPFPRS